MKLITIINEDTRTNGKEVIILKSSLSNALYQEFLDSYQSYNTQTQSNSNSKPFVYVDPEGGIKIITDVVDSFGGENEIFALSVANDGFVEFLAFQDA